MEKKIEFNLSEKIIEEDYYDCPFLVVVDVKEFIRRLKEEIINPKEWYGITEALKSLDKLAGEKLR